jgi:hypothetical protein
MTHISCHNHPLIYAHLLQQPAYDHIQSICVESLEQAQKLLSYLEWMITLHKTSHIYRVIETLQDYQHALHHGEIGIYTPETYRRCQEVDQADFVRLSLQKDQWLTEEQFIEWLIDHHYRADTTGEVGTYFRRGDMVTVILFSGVLRVSFFHGKIESLQLDETQHDTYVLIPFFISS